MNAFKAYDIRGIYKQDFDKEDVYKIGFFLPELLNTKKILVGRDIRLSSPEIFTFLSQGIQDAGADVYDLGLCTTPMVYWGTASFGFSASVMITASHNPKDYNGLKISRANAQPVGFDSGLSELERWLSQRSVRPVSEKGKLINFSQSESYMKFQKQFVPDISELKIAIDASHGMAGLFVRELYGNRPHYIYDNPDGNFPQHGANPLEAENRKDIEKLVKKVGADIGVIFDGDADRVMFVDEKGHFISPDILIAVMVHHFEKNENLSGQKVLQDIRSSLSVSEYLQVYGLKVHTWKVGRAYAAAKLREIDALFGGELAGHYYFKSFFYSDSALMAASFLLGVFNEYKKKGISVSELIKSISKYANSGELNFRLERKTEAMEAVKNEFLENEKPLAFYDFDGYRIEYKNWWFNIRLSNTEPYLRLIVEAKTKVLLDEKIEQIKEKIERFS